MKIDIRNVTKRFGGFTALRDVSLTVEPGELVALLGPSGCGKTTLLRILSGLDYADSGRILFDGEDAGARSVASRRVGFVFQHYALFRHMTVFENIAFGLRVRRRNRFASGEIRRRVERLLDLVKIEGMAHRYPAQLSGGQRQRVALARALAVEPSVLLLDEPFGALDARVRKDLRRWLRQLHDNIHITSVFVTHDVEEALEVADRIVVIDAGRVEQIGTPDEVYEKPATAFVCRFLGSVNLFHALMEGDRIAALRRSGTEEGAVLAHARPHDLDLAREAWPEASLEAEVVRVQAVGPIVRIELRRSDNGEAIEAELSKERQREAGFRPGERIHVRPRRVQVFDPIA